MFKPQDPFETGSRANISTWHICLGHFLFHNLGARTKRPLHGPYGKGAAVSVPTTVAILGGNSVAGRALEALLQGVGYSTRLVEDPFECRPEELLDGIKLVLLAPTLSAESRELFLAEMSSTLDASGIPVLTLSTTLKEALGDQPSFIPWPCRLEDLTKNIETALLGVPEVGKA